MEFFGGFFWDCFENILEIFYGIFPKDFFKEFFGGIFWRNFFGRIFLGGFFGRIIWRIFWEEFFVCIGIDMFVKILVFVKILSQRRRKEEGRTRNLDP